MYDKPSQRKKRPGNTFYCRLNVVVSDEFKSNVADLICSVFDALMTAALNNVCCGIGECFVHLRFHRIIDNDIFTAPANTAIFIKAEQKHRIENKTDKPWGYEKILILTEMYSTKELYIKEGFRTSLHYHIEKDETMYILSGSGYIEFEDKKKLFLLDLSFIGWGILCMLTLGILGLWILPYYYMTSINAYQFIKKANNLLVNS